MIPDSSDVWQNLQTLTTQIEAAAPAIADLKRQQAIVARRLSAESFASAVEEVESRRFRIQLGSFQQAQADVDGGMSLDRRADQATSEYQVDLDRLEKRAKAIARNSRRVLDPSQRERMKESAANYRQFIKKARLSIVPTHFRNESDFYAAVESLTEQGERGPEERIRQDKTPKEWESLRGSAIKSILEDPANLRDYDPDELEQLSQKQGLSGTPTGRAYTLLAAEMRAGRIPTRLPKGRTLELARLLVSEAKHGPALGQRTAGPSEGSNVAGVGGLFRRFLGRK